MGLDKVIGKRIQQARKMQGYSQEELAKLLDYESGTAIHYFEKGLRKIKVEDLKRFANYLNTTVDFFLKEEPDDKLMAILYRAGQSLSPSAQDKLEDFIDHISEFTNNYPVKRVDLSKLRPYAAAEKLLKSADEKEPPVDVEKIAESCGLIVQEWDFVDEVSAVLIDAPDFSVIGVNEQHKPNRRRFSIAHELGHFVMGHTDDLFIEFLAPELFQEQSPQRVDQEREANWFAADLLMPKSWIEKDWRQSYDLTEMAKKYMVSEQAMWIRLQHFGLGILQTDDDVPF